MFKKYLLKRIAPVMLAVSKEKEVQATGWNLSAGSNMFCSWFGGYERSED